MRKLLLGVLLVYFPLCSLANSKTLTVPDQYPTVQKAIDMAVSGDTIEVKPGLYREALTFKDGITLTGTDRAKSILTFDTRKSPLLISTSCNGVIKNLTFESEGINPSPANEKYNPLLKFIKSSVNVENCILQKSCGNGINIENGSQCGVIHCLMQNNRRNGIIAIGKGTSANLQDNQCIQNGLNGLGFGSEATGTATANECRNNQLHGIAVSDKGTTAILKENRCHTNSFNGIMFINAKSGSVEGNLCQGNLWHGISLADKLASVVLKNNRCLENECCGFYFENENQNRVEGNLCQNNGEINYGYLRYLLLQENFAELESVAAQLRTKKPRFHSGEWQLYFYYTDLTND